MKKQLRNVFVLACAAMALNSCGSDDNGQPVVHSGELLGTWIYDKESWSVNGVWQYQDAPYEGNIAGCEKDEITFFADHTVEEADYDGSGCTLTFHDGTWSRGGNTLVVNLEDEVGVPVEIIELTDTSLIVKQTYEEEGNQEVFILKFVR